MKMKKQIVFIMTLFLISHNYGQQIILNEDITDWTEDALVSIDEGDGSGIDINNLYVANDDNSLFFRFDVNQEMLIQQDNDIIMYIDLDNDPLTGNLYFGIGADLIFNFANRQGSYISNQSIPIFHSDIGLITSPTVSSTTFELSIDRTFNFNNASIADTISFYFTAGALFKDLIPNENETNEYIMKSNISPNYSFPNVLKNGNEDLRILSYNVLRDNIFQNNTANSYGRILKNIDADIFCFQEIYDHSANNVLNKLQELDVISDISQWSAAKDGSDLITVSKYPILFHKEINGNSIVVVNKDGQDFIIFNCHLPCCDNDSGREDEIDDILRYIRASLEGNSDYPILMNTPYVILGDMNFVGFSQQVSSLLNGDIFDNNMNGPDFELDWDRDGLTDLKPQTTGATSLFTWYNPQGSYSAGRLDYIFFTDAVLQPLNSYVLNTDLLSSSQLQNLGLNASDTGVASDHLPVVVDFAILMTSIQLSGVTSNLKIFPNPSSNYINIDLDEKIEAYQIISPDGKIMAFEIVNDFSKLIDISQLSSGMYFITVKTKEEFIKRQFVVE